MVLYRTTSRGELTSGNVFSMCRRKFKEFVILILVFVIFVLASHNDQCQSEKYLHEESKAYAPLEREISFHENDCKYEKSSDDYILLTLSKECQLPEAETLDCYPEPGVSKENCEKRGCCWHEKPLRLRSKYEPYVQKEVELFKGPSSCYYPNNFDSYHMDSPRQTPFGITAELRRDVPTPYPDDIMDLQLNVYFETDNRIRFKIFDPNNQRYEVPIDVPKVEKSASLERTKYEFKYNDKSERFGISIIRKSSKTVLFNCGIGPLIFADQFIQLSSSLASKYIYGLGEHRGSFLHDVNWSRYAFWSRDVFPAENLNLYSVHPFYLSIEDDGNAHGVFLLNSNAMEAILQPSPSITWRTIGGVLDFYVFLGPSPDQVIQQYTEVIGRTFMPPYWGLGFHLCRWGYETVDGTRKITDRMRNAKIPQDVQWNDIDYAIDYKDFTLNEKVFGDLPKFIDELHNNDQHYIHIVDPGIAADSAPGTYEPFDLGKKMDIFIKLDGKYIEGKVWTNVTVFPDFINPKTSEWWYRMISEWYKKVHFDGLWIDMNEPVQFGNGSLIGCPQSKYDNPPYTPGIFEGILKAFTLCASADQYKSKHYDVHSLYGLTEMKATFEAIARIRLGKRPFIILRSTYPSSGKYGGHWLGDNFSKWKDMWYSIPGILNFNMFGIPLVGADICGFNNNSNEALCQRWHQLGAFYPFSRNHNSLHMVNSTEKCKDQDPTAFSEAMQISTRDVLLKRYYLLPYLYTLFHKSHVNGTTVARPLFFEFPHDDYALTVDTQFLWGEALLISPVLQEGAVTVTAYFPNHSWYDFDTGVRVPGLPGETGKNLTLKTPMDKINLHIRGGNIIPAQEPGITTKESRQNKFHLIVALCTKNEADGELYLDDGDTLDAYEQELYAYVRFQANATSVISQIVKLGFTGSDSADLGLVKVFGVVQQPSYVSANGVKAQFSYKNKVLTIEKLNLSLLKPFTIVWK